MRRGSLCLLLCLFACRKQAAAAPDAGDEEEIRPVYARAEPLPLAQKLCGAIQDSGGFAAGECVNTVSSALRSGAIEIDPAKVDACVAAKARCAGMPAECHDLVRGVRKSGDTCRSSLECGDGLHCHGVSTTQAGRCGAPKGDGLPCRLAADVLSGYLRENEDRHHPECSGFCGHMRCEPVRPAGSACVMQIQCARGEHCDGKTCVDGAFAGAGEKCVGDACGAGLSCVKGLCAAASICGG